ncbi:MAG: beta-propeller fold lactonase family protein [Buchnera aphidicola (Eriosoma harunire)]
MYQTVYLATPNSNQIEVWSLNSNNGILKLIQIVKIKGEIQPICIYKEKNILYAGIRKSNFIISYHISHLGILKEISYLQLPDPINHISINRKQKLLFCSSYHSGTLTIVNINHLGHPNNIQQIISHLPGCHSATCDLQEKIVLVAALKKNKIYLYEIHNGYIVTNKIQKYISTINSLGPRHIICHQNKKNIYSINELNSTIDVWLINNVTYAISHIQNINFMPKGFDGIHWGSEIRILPNGKFLYASDRTENIISIFNINNYDGTLTYISQIYTEIIPRSFDIDIYGQYLIVAGQQSNSISVYEISSHSGLLNYKHRYSVGHGPLWVLINQ